ncbi:MAG: ACP S-malonyltransferase [Pseudomonadota bacterium]
MKQKAVVIAPGRGTYNKPELGTLGRRHRAFVDELYAFDDLRVEAGQTKLSDLDGAERYSIKTHTRGDNASALIFACSYFDFLSIDRDKFEVIGVTGNSMGWYTALTCGGALNHLNGFNVVNTMGTLMQRSLIGGQLIYTFVDQNWQPVPGKREEIDQKIFEIERRKDHELALSIELGGMIVLGGNAAGLDAFEAEMPVMQERFPMRLENHAAFHTALQFRVAEQGRRALSQGLFEQPNIPMIDGRGAIWNPKSCDLNALWDYTLNHQVVAPYDFTAAMRTAALELMPDVFIILGPGSTLYGAVAQSLIQVGWRGIADKDSFKANVADRIVALGSTR